METQSATAPNEESIQLAHFLKKDQRKSHDILASRFSNPVMTDRISASVADSLEVKRRFFDARADEVQRAAGIIAAAFKASGKLLVFGIGGSAAGAEYNAVVIRD